MLISAGWGEIACRRLRRCVPSAKAVSAVKARNFRRLSERRIASSCGREKERSVDHDLDSKGMVEMLAWKGLRGEGYKMMGKMVAS